MEGALQDRGTFRGIALTLLTLALLAERAASRSFPVRFFVLAILYRAEAIARAFVARAVEADCADLPCPDLLCVEPSAIHSGAADAEFLALRLRMLAAVLGALADAAGDSDDRSDGDAGWVPYAAAPRLPVLLIVRLPRKHFAQPPRPPDTS
ncbi:hypothetical protein RHIZO_04619 [Rhizobiaceae bacterium]|nr:hypothetical protein RHIZO_04619 [Rhizobiaceae bacterium]